MRLGFAVKILGPDGGGIPTHDARRHGSEPSLERSLELARVALAWIAACRIRYWRLSSDFVPYGTHPDLPRFHGQPARFARELASFGYELRRVDVRVSMHPSQYILLSSPDAGVTERSLADLALQCELLDRMEVGPEGIVLLHVGGRYGDPAAAADRVVRRIGTLPEAQRRRLCLEHDDRLWDAAETLAICRRAGVPMVFDHHHHRCLDRAGWSAGEALAAAAATWPEDVVPEVHLSSGRTGPTDRAHADGVVDDDWRALVAALPERDVDVLLEAKHKDHAVLDLAARIRAGALPRPARLDPLPERPSYA